MRKYLTGKCGSASCMDGEDEPSAVVEKAPTAPAVEEAANEAISTEHFAAIDAPGARVKSTPPPLPKAGQTHMSEDSPPHHEVPMYVPVVLGEQSQVPAVADEPCLLYTSPSPRD